MNKMNVMFALQQSKIKSIEIEKQLAWFGKMVCSKSVESSVRDIKEADTYRWGTDLVLFILQTLVKPGPEWRIMIAKAQRFRSIALLIYLLNMYFALLQNRDKIAIP